MSACATAARRACSTVKRMPSTPSGGRRSTPAMSSSSGMKGRWPSTQRWCPRRRRAPSHPRGEQTMHKHLTCECGHMTHADSDEEMVRKAQEHMRAAHGKIITREEVLKMAKEAKH